MFEGIDQVPWKRLQDCRGPATDIPQFLRDIASKDKDTALDAVCDGLWDRLCHQGTLYEASRYAIPFLIELLRDGHLDGSEFRVDVLKYLSICAGTAEREPADFDMRDRLVKGWEVYKQLRQESDPEIQWHATQLTEWCVEPMGAYAWKPHRVSIKLGTHEPRQSDEPNQSFRRRALSKPKIKPDQFYVLLAERNTGIVVTMDGHRWIGEGDPQRDLFLVCNTLKDAEENAAAILRNYEQCIAMIYDSDHRGVREMGS